MVQHQSNIYNFPLVLKVILGFVILIMIMIWTIPMFFNGKIGNDISIRFNECSDNSTCDVLKFCNEGKCVNACNNVSCHRNENCKVIDHIASCECQPNFKHNDKKECRKECYDNGMCEQNEYCQNNLCVPIVDENNCGQNARKIFINHKQFCVCPPGFGGRPYDLCRKRCNTDEECEDSDTCHKNLCIDACNPFITPCPYMKKCEIKNHTANCVDGIDIYEPCQLNSDCDADSFCYYISSVCIPQCGPDDCGDHQICVGQDYEPLNGRAYRCSCDLEFIVQDDSLKCYKPCNNDTICEENEYCDNLNHCIPRKY